MVYLSVKVVLDTEVLGKMIVNPQGWVKLPKETAGE